MRRVLLAVGGLLLLFSTFANPVHAQGATHLEDVRVEYSFGQQITFLARVVSETPVLSATLFFRQESGENTHTVSLQPDETGLLRYTYDTSAQILPPFVPVLFWFQISLENGETFTSVHYRFRYADNRFPWQTQTEEELILHWYDGDEAFVREALDAARVGMDTIRSMFPISEGEPIEIYIYHSPSDLQSTLYLGGESWMAGEANPALGVVLVAIPPGPQQGIAMKRLIPHELAHVMLYRYLGESYNRLPTWLQEGIPSIVELYPNPDYPRALDLAVENESLFPISALCDAFPRDASGAFLAYAEAESFTRYLRATYGDSGLEALLSAYADGLDCEQGAARALGVSLRQLDMQWREETLGENVLGFALRNLSPYLAILLVLLLVPLWNGVKTWRKIRTK
jgi:hypothetical protein